jgi:hypothetical protein
MPSTGVHTDRHTTQNTRAAKNAGVAQKNAGRQKNCGRRKRWPPQIITATATGSGHVAHNRDMAGGSVYFKKKKIVDVVLFIQPTPPLPNKNFAFFSR